jgi:hypothetical protein
VEIVATNARAMSDNAGQRLGLENLHPDMALSMI